MSSHQVTISSHLHTKWKSFFPIWLLPPTIHTIRCIHCAIHYIKSSLNLTEHPWHFKALIHWILIIIITNWYKIIISEKVGGAFRNHRKIFQYYVDCRKIIKIFKEKTTKLQNFNVNIRKTMHYSNYKCYCAHPNINFRL